jgi:hypothetical protein
LVHKKRAAGPWLAERRAKESPQSGQGGQWSALTGRWRMVSAPVVNITAVHVRDERFKLAVCRRQWMKGKGKAIV